MNVHTGSLVQKLSRDDGARTRDASTRRRLCCAKAKPSLGQVAMDGADCNAAYELGLLAHSRAVMPEALNCFRESLSLALQLEHSLAVSYALDRLGSVAAAQAQPERAACLFAEARTLRLPVGDFMAASFRSDLERGVASAVLQMDEGAFAAAWSMGEATNRSEAADYALRAS